MKFGVEKLVEDSITLRAAAKDAHRLADQATLSGQGNSIDRSVGNLRKSAAEADILADRAERIVRKLSQVHINEYELVSPPKESSEAFLPVRRVTGFQADEVRHYEHENRSVLAWMRPLGEVSWPRELYIRVRGGMDIKCPTIDTVPRVRVCVANATVGNAFEVGDATQFLNNPGSGEASCGCFEYKFEAFLVKVHGPHDTVAIEIIKDDDDDEPLAVAAVPLHGGSVTQSKYVLLMDNGRVVVDYFWIEDSSFQVSKGDFFYRVCRKGGADLFYEPSWRSKKTDYKMKCGELLRSEEQVEDVSDGIVYTEVKVENDSCSRSGWICESIGNEKWLQPLAPPRRQVGQFFYKVLKPEGIQLYCKAEPNSPVEGTVYPLGTIFEASQKYTPVASFITFVRVDISRGFLFEKAEPELKRRSIFDSCQSESVQKSSKSEIEKLNGSSVTVEEIDCPTGQVIHEETGHFIYRVTIERGIFVRDKPHIVAKHGELLRLGIHFAATTRVLVKYEGLGEVEFVQRLQDKAWVRSTKAGVSLLELVPDKVEKGPFTYVVVHENGVVVRATPDLNSQPAVPHMIMPVRRVFQVSERIQKAEDIVSSTLPTVFLHLSPMPGAGGREGWVFERRGSTSICQDVTERAERAAAGSWAD